MRGFARRLPYHLGWSRDPPLLATAAYTPSCSTRMSGTLRMAPVFTPRIVSMTTGRFITDTDLVSPVASILSTCLRTHVHVLGTYSLSLTDSPR